MDEDLVQVALAKIRRKQLLKPGEVAAVLDCDPKTVTRWASSTPPKIRSIRTPGGHRRFFATDIAMILSGGKLPAQNEGPQG
jgi:hypothetical protein